MKFTQEHADLLADALTVVLRSAAPGWYVTAVWDEAHRLFIVMAMGPVPGRKGNDHNRACVGYVYDTGKVESTELFAHEYSPLLRGRRATVFNTPLPAFVDFNKLKKYVSDDA